MSALSLRGLGVEYAGVPAVSDVSFDVASGSVTAVVGPSGSGKSSLLLAINRLHTLDRKARVRGEVWLGTTDTAAIDDYTLRRRIGLIFQRPTPFPLSISENVAFPLRAHGVPAREIGANVEAALRRAALWSEVKDRLAAPARTLSGGQQQRLCIARALALDPDVLLLDEPCASLDPLATALVEETLVGLSGTTTILLVTHNLGQAHRLAQEVVCLWPGQRGGALLDHGRAQRVFEQPASPTLEAWFAGRTG